MRLMLFATWMMLAAPPAPSREAEAKKLAEDLLTKGATLFDSRDVKALAATFTDDALFTFVSKESETGRVKSEEYRGQLAIEDFYRKLFDGQNGKTVSRNFVDFARLVSSDVLVIDGHFQPDTAKDESFPFVQVRVKQGDKWLLKNLQVFFLPKP
jgi:hypothetical protein